MNAFSCRLPSYLNKVDANRSKASAKQNKAKQKLSKSSERGGRREGEEGQGRPINKRQLINKHLFMNKQGGGTEGRTSIQRQ